MPPKRAIKFTAVSSADQAKDDAASLPAQSRILDELAKARGVEIIDHIEVPGFTRNFYTWDEFAREAHEAGHDAGIRMQKHWEDKDFDEILVFDGTRFGRKESIFIEFVLRTLDTGAIIVKHIGGTLEYNSYGAMMFEAYAAGQEGRTRKERLKMGREKRYDDKKHYSDVPMTHIELHDAEHHPMGVYELNPAMTPVWQDVKTLVMEGVSWQYLERDLYDRFKHVNPKTGRQWTRQTFYRLLTRSPMTWGIISRYHSQDARVGKINRSVVLHWMYDDRVPIPDGVMLTRDACPAVFTGEDALMLMAELRRRRDITGHMSPSNSYPFSGLCVCDECGLSMKVKSAAADHARTRLHYYMACNYIHHNCPNQRSVRFEVIQTFLDRHLRDVLMTGQWDDAPVGEVQSPLKTLNTEVTRLTSQISALINELSLAPDSARAAYRAQINTLSARLDMAQRDIEALDRSAQQKTTQQQRDTRVIAKLREITLEGLWALPNREINQFLKEMFNGRKIVIHRKEIIGIIEASPRTRRPSS